MTQSLFCKAELYLPNIEKLLAFGRNESCKWGVDGEANFLCFFFRQLYECVSVNVSFLSVGEG